MTRFALLLVVMLGGSFLELLTLGAVPLFVALVANPNVQNQQVELFRQSIQAFDLPDSGNPVLWAGCALALLFIIRTCYLVASYALQERMLKNRHIELSTKLFSAYLNAPYAFHLQRNSSTCIDNVFAECESVVLYVLDGILNITRNGIVLLTVVVLMLYYDPIVCLGVFAALAVTAGGFMFATRRKLDEIGKAIYLERQQVLKHATEGIGAFKEAQILNQKKAFKTRFHGAMESMCNHTKLRTLISKSTWPIMELITCVIILATMAIMTVARYDHESIAPTMALVAVCLARLKGTITEMMIFASYFKAHQSVTQALAKDIQELDALPQESGDALMQKLACTEKIELKGVSFAYPNADEATIKNVSLSVPVGTSLALVGPTGSGKTTIAHLVVGLLSPSAGTLRVDNNVIDTPDQVRSWQNNIGYVAQDSFLIDDTLKANIAFGLNPEQIDEAQLQFAVESAQLTEFVQALPNGLDTLVGERGVRLSGGQRQRIAIARALYNNPQFLLFDEATSALDVTTEQAVVQALDSLSGTHTIVVIAHRLSTVKTCDSIAYVKDGTVLAQGSFDQLCKILPEFNTMANA